MLLSFHVCHEELSWLSFAIPAIPAAIAVCRHYGKRCLCAVKRLFVSE